MGRAKLVVDVDGVLCDLVGSAIPVINRVFGCNLARDDIRMFEMDRVVGVKKDDFNQIFEQLDYSAMQVIEGAAEGLAELQTQFPIVVATSRPQTLHSITETWLGDNGLVFDAFMPPREADSPIVTKSGLYSKAEVAIDDDLREAISASDFTKVTCLLDSPWNHSINAENKFVRCRNWHEIVAACISGCGC